MTLWFLPDQVFDGGALRTGLALGLSNGVVSALAPTAEVTAHKIAGLATPAYVDLQVNGAGGVMLNSNPTAAAMAVMAAALRPLGTGTILPTVITDAPEVLARAVDAALEAKGELGLLGLHIEGPHIAPARRGTHAAQYIRPFDAQTLAHVARLRKAGVAVMITLAPEAAGPRDVAALVDLGAVVSIGHSDATAGEAQALLGAGARAFTHVFNAMSPMLGRAPGVTGAALTSAAACGIICDGVHVDDAMIGLALRARPAGAPMFLVSDAMATVGGPPHFTLYGQEIALREGRLVNASGALAGAHITLAQSVARLITRVGAPPQTALKMAISTPARLMGADHLAGLLGRRPEDVLLLGADWMPTGTLAGAVAAASKRAR